MAIMSQPASPLATDPSLSQPAQNGSPGMPDWRPAVGSAYSSLSKYTTYKVQTDDSLVTVADAINAQLGLGWTWEDLTLYNWGTRVPAEINWYLYNYVGSHTPTADGNNLIFTTGDLPGLIFIPVTDPGPRNPAAPGNGPVTRPHPGARLPVLQSGNSVTIQTQPCSGYAREMTLSDEMAGRVTFDSPGVSVDLMDPRTHFHRPRAERIAWYADNMCRFRKQLQESDVRNHVPSHLIACVILNEMADINLVDQMQDRVDANDASVGPAQIQVSTALDHGLVDIPPYTVFKADYVSKRLQIMQVAIEAAAREIRRILEHMTANLAKPWQAAHGFMGYDPAAADLVYNAVDGADERSRVLWLTEMVIAAYNSPDIVIAVNPGTPLLQGGAVSDPYPNGRIHGSNGAAIAADLYDAQMFLGGALNGPLGP